MRAAPPVQVQLATGQVERGVIAGMHGLAGAAVSTWAQAWQLPSAPWPQQVLIAALICALAVGLGWRVARSVLPPTLQWLGWTGQVWQLTRAQATPLPLTTLHAQIDLGHWVLLRFSAAGGAAGWLVAAVQTDPGGWHLFRVALQAHGGESPSAGRPDPSDA